MKKLLLIFASLSFFSPMPAFAAHTDGVLGMHDGLPCIVENASQAHSQRDYVIITVKNMKKNIGHIRISVWDSKQAYDKKENGTACRSSSYDITTIADGEIHFKIEGLGKDKKYVFFAYHDINSDNILNRRFKVPTEPYMFSNAANHGTGAGLTREGCHAPSFESTAITYTGPGQKILLAF